MIAAFCNQPGRLELRDVPRPTLGKDEVLVRVRNCGVCGSDLHWFHGSFPLPGVCPGHEIAGDVVEVGPEVISVAAGARVAVEPLVVCRECSFCRTGDYQLCPRFRVLGTMRDGGFAEYLAMPAYALYELPGEVSYEVGALAEPTAVCVHAIRLAGVQLGQRVLVIGAGTIGLLAALVARTAGAGEVAITARHPHQAEMARRLGATHVFTTTPDGDRERSEYAFRHGIDIVIETVGGSGGTLNDAILAVRPGGTVAVVGVFTASPACNALALVVKEVRLVGSLTYGRSGPRADFDVAIDVLRAHAPVVRELITHRYELAAIQAAFETASDKTRGAIKVTVTP